MLHSNKRVGVIVQPYKAEDLYVVPPSGPRLQGRYLVLFDDSTEAENADPSDLFPIV